MAKILLVDTNFSSIPIHEALVQAGHDVHVVGASPGDALAKISSKYFCLDYSNVFALRNFVQEQGIEYLVPGCTDRSYESCVTVGQGAAIWLGDCPQAHDFISNKSSFRQVAERLGLPVPVVFSESEACLAKAPIIVKPVDSFSGRGMTILDRPNVMGVAEAMSKAKEASPTGHCLIEQFVEGQLYSHSAFFQNGKVVVDFIVQEDCTVNPFAVDTSRLINSGVEDLRIDLRKCMEELANELCLVDGLLHTQFIHNGRQFWLIESTRRCPGDLYAQLIEMSSGFPYAEFYAAHFLGKITGVPETKWIRPIIRHTISVGREQSLIGLGFSRAVHVECYIPIKSVGDDLGVGAKGRVGLIFFRDTEFKESDDLYQAILRKDLYKVFPSFNEACLP
ncbi:ATP-grasp domain-containing protein [Comamonas sp. J-3]|uniref:ATP-grasp domain-containing protein n=1 Tax=Comamonas trifloxystrobinivorans TaxID=3350256 RepID=UPI003727D11F